MAAVTSYHHRLRKSQMTHSTEARLATHLGRRARGSCGCCCVAVGWGRAVLPQEQHAHQWGQHPQPRQAAPVAPWSRWRRCYWREEKPDDWIFMAERMRSMFVSVFGDVFVACFVCLQFRTRKKTPFICRDQSFRTRAAPRMNLEPLSRPTLWQTVNMNSIKPANPNKTAAEHRDPTMNPATAKKGACVSFFESQDNNDSLRKQALTMTRTWTKMACVVFSCERELLEQVEKKKLIPTISPLNIPTFSLSDAVNNWEYTVLLLGQIQWNLFPFERRLH